MLITDVQKTKLAKILQKEADKYGGSYELFAKSSKISGQNLRAWKNERTFPSLENLERLAKYFNVSLDEFCQKLQEQSETRSPSSKPQRTRMRAEDVLPMIEDLSEKEVLRLIQILAEYAAEAIAV